MVTHYEPLTQNSKKTKKQKQMKVGSSFKPKLIVHRVGNLHTIDWVTSMLWGG